MFAHLFSTSFTAALVVSLAAAQSPACPDGRKLVELQPIEIDYPGPPPSTSVITLTRTATDPGYVTTTVPGTRSTPYTVTGTPPYPGASTPVSIFVPPTSSPPGYHTMSVSGTRTTPYTVTGTPSYPGDSTPVSIYEPSTSSPSPPPVSTAPPSSSSMSSSSSSSSSSTTPSSTAPSTPPSTPTPTPTPTTTPPPSTPTFSCESYGYLIQTRALIQVDLATNDQTLIKNDVGPGGNINAIGYNIKDNRIYGVVASSDDTNTVISIGSDGSYKPVNNLTLPSGFWNVGDVDEDGNLWVTQSGGVWNKINVDPSSSQYGTVIDQGTSSLDGGVSDWVYVPGTGNYLWSVQDRNDDHPNSKLVRWDRSSHTWSTQQTYDAPFNTGTIWIGALYASSDGKMYGSWNQKGEIYQFPVPSGTPQMISSGNTTSLNDGARCAKQPSI